ncbi:MAG: hypothetical protein R6U96_05035 [Promethearchaeia archaeon]
MANIYFEIDNFSKYEDLDKYIKKLNKYLRKDKERKINKIFDKFKDFIEEDQFIIPITYILSILAEEKIDLIEEDIISAITPYLESDDIKLRTNSIIILGFYLLQHPSLIKEYFNEFTELLMEGSPDLKENGYYFLQKFIEINPKLIKNYKNLLLKALKKEKEKKNIISLLTFLNECDILNFKQTFKLREILIQLLKKYQKRDNPKFAAILHSLIPKFFQTIDPSEVKDSTNQQMIDLLNKHFIMNKYNFTKISKKRKIRFKTFLKKFKQTRLKEEEIYFYAKDHDRNIIFFFELEKDKLYEYFQNPDEKIPRSEILKEFSSILEGEEDLELFITTLTKLGIIKGYLSEFYYYPLDFLKQQILETLEKKGIVKLKNYKFLPPKFIKTILSNADSEDNITILTGKGHKSYYSLKLIQNQINSESARYNVIDLSEFQNRLIKRDFIKLIKRLPEGYLTDIHKGTVWLTNIGLIKIKNAIEDSKVIGFLDLKKISEKLEIKKDILVEVLKEFIDFRSGVWDNGKETFYYSKYIKERINNIAKIAEKEKQNKQIINLSEELNISRKRILTKLEENYQLIGEEIKKKDQIRISEYIEKLGMKSDQFMKFIKDLDINFLKKGDLLIFEDKKIESAQKELKSTLIKNAKEKEYFDLEEFEINASLVTELLQQLIDEGKLNGIFYNTEDGKFFYTVKGIQNMMLGTEITLYFEDLFYGKELNEREIALLKKILKGLIKSGELKGTFDEEQLAFSREVLKFADDFFGTLQSFERMIEEFQEKFDQEFQEIKSILTKKEDVIYPQEIKIVEKSVKRIKKHYLGWQNRIDAFIHRHNKRLLKEQGYSISRYNGLAADEKQEIRSFKDDERVEQLVEGFDQWVRLFKEIENNYGKIIFNQKKIQRNPENQEAREKLEEMLYRLNMES